MRFRHLKFTPALIALLAMVAGCHGPVLTGGFHGSPYQGYGVDGPGPGVLPESYQQTSRHGAFAAPTPGMMPMAAPLMQTSQINFRGPESLVLHFDAKVPGTFDSEPIACPATHDFFQGNIYRLRASNIPGYPGKELFPTLEVAPTMARTQAFLSHNTVPVELTPGDFDQVFAGNFITKVVYLPNPEYHGLAMAGVGTLVNTQLEAGADPVIEASKRGAILAIIRMGNKDLSGEVAERQALAASGMMMPMMPGYPSQMTGGSVPQNPISGINVPAFGTPMTKTTTGIPGPPQLPQGRHAVNRNDVIRTEPIPAAPRG